MAETAAGPSRAATVQDETDDVAMNGAGAGPSTANSNGNGVKNEVDGDEAEGEGLGEDGLPRNACATLYLHNLNEKVRIPVMKETLASLFKPYRPITPIVAHRNTRMRGQAFVSFHDKASAEKARSDVNEFPLYGKPIIISYAKTRSDAVIVAEDGEEALEEWKKVRLEDKKVKRRTNPIRLKARAKQKAGDDGEAPAAKKPRMQMPDEYLPPNNVLFVQNLPEGTTQDDLRDVFEQHAGLLEIRTIPAKRDIAFIEFADEATAMVAKDALHNFKIDGETKMKVTYARK